jgi:hypothetical protein
MKSQLGSQRAVRPVMQRGRCLHAQPGGSDPEFEHRRADTD